ncbi:hypothetical protein L7F22_067592 [Adiantum nelumboides]|nr:hypothetical protein [Adiantum nelumboides]
MDSTSDLPAGLTEILEESPSKKLLDAIIQEGCDTSFWTDAISIVNPSVDFYLLVQNATQYIFEEWQKFELSLQMETIKIDDSLTTSENESQQTSEVDQTLSFQSVSTIENLDKAEELQEEPIDLAPEEKESANLDVALFRAEIVVDEPTEDVPPFQLREDYCLAAIAEASQVAKDFVDIEEESKEELLALDLETSNQKFLEGPYAFEFCLKRVAEEEPALKDADFEARLVEHGIGKFGRNVLAPYKINDDLGAKINLEHEGQIEADELQKIELLDEDNFLGRVGGSRVTSKYTSHALIHYLPKLDKDVFCALHSQFTDHPELPMFSIKTLSRFMGFLPLPNYVNRILVLERAAAFKIFGYAPGFHGSRARYFLCYSSYFISNKDTNVKLLAGYKRRKFLRYREKLLETNATKCIFEY